MEQSVPLKRLKKAQENVVSVLEEQDVVEGVEVAEDELAGGSPVETKGKKGKGKKGKKKSKSSAPDKEEDEEELKPKKKGKKKGGKKEAPEVKELQFGEKSKQEVSELGSEGRYSKRERSLVKDSDNIEKEKKEPDVIEVLDSKGTKEDKQPAEIIPTEGPKDVLVSQLDEEEKRDSEKEGRNGEDVSKESIEGDGTEVRRRATLSELRGESIDKTEEEKTTPTTAEAEGLTAVTEEAAERKTDEDTKETKVDIELERKMSRQDSLKSIKVIPTNPKDQVAVSLSEVEEGVEVGQEAAEDGVDKEETKSEEVGKDVAVEVDAAITPEQSNELEAVVEDKPDDITKEIAVEVSHEGEGGDSKVDEENITEADDKTKPFLEYEVEDELPWVMYRNLNPPQGKLPIEEDDDWPNSDEEVDFEPPDNEDLSDLDEVMGKLDGGESELETSSPPPPIIKPEEKVQQTQKIEELKLGVAEEQIFEYIEEFERKMEEEIVMIGQISLEEIQEEERHLRDEHIAYQQQEAKLQRHRLEEILQRMEEAKKLLMKKLKEKRRSLQRREEHIMQQDRLIQNRIHRAFRRAESQLLKALKARKGEVKTMYGDLILADGQYGGSKGRRWKVDWNRTPQPIQIKLKCLRGVKDKLPAGRYVLMVSLYDRLGGHVLKWSSLKGQQWGGATLPLHHDGEFFNIEIKIDQSVFTVCPARPDVRPGMILVFELFILRGSITATDRVVGWGCFPVCDGEFNIVEGKYKVPFLRGDMDSSIDKHEKIEELLAQDLENWLCNMYFEVVKLPRYMAGQKEYEIELQFSSSLVGYPARTNTGEEFVDGEEPIYGSRLDLKSIASPSSSRRASRISMLGGSSFLGSTMDLKAGEDKEKAQGSTVDLQVEVPDMKILAKRKQSLFVPGERESASLRRASAASQGRRMSAVSQGRRMSAVSQSRRMSRPMTVHMSRKVMEAEGSSEGSGTDYSDDEVLMLKKDDGFKPVKGQPGMFYKKHHNNPVDIYAKKMFTLLPKTPVLTRRKKRNKLSHLEELDQHTFSVKRPWSNKGRIHHKGREKMQYVGRQLLAELGLSQWRSREFWAMMLMLAITWWIRLYTHYGGQWLYLTALQIPINKFEFLPYTTNLNYQNTLLHTEEEIALVIMGPFANIIVFCLQIIAAWAIQSLFGIFPNILSRFIMAFGINTLLDPFWIVMVDAAILRYLNLGGDVPIGDAFKLYWHFDRYEKNGAVGIVLTLFLYVVTLFTASTILYMYFLRLHNNGRLMDVYHRLHANEDSFLIPYDLEVSNEELNYICKKGEQWRGEEGERRKTAVFDYIWEEEQVDESEMVDASQKKTGHREITTHVSIHSLHLDGLRELYRHFLRLPDGAIVEVFNEMGLAGMDEGIKQALIKGTSYQGMDNTAASRTSLRSRKRSPSAGSINSFRRPSVLLEVPKTAPTPSPV